jgi:hypothetical protein
LLTEIRLPNIQTPVGISRLQSLPFSVNLLFPSSLVLFHFFFFPSTLALHHERLDLYVLIFNDERMVTLRFSTCPSLSHHD